MWDDVCFSIQNSFEGAFTLTENIKGPYNSCWWLTAIYSPVKCKDRSALWIDLMDLSTTCSQA